MSNTPHTLGEEFPDQLVAIHSLKAKDERFARTLDEYDDVNDQIHRAETRIEPISEQHEAALRKRRLALKGAVAAALSADTSV